MTVKLYWVMNQDKTEATLSEEQEFDSEREADNWISIALKGMRKRNKENKKRGYYCPAYILVARDNGKSINERYVTL